MWEYGNEQSELPLCSSVHRTTAVSAVMFQRRDAHVPAQTRNPEPERMVGSRIWNDWNLWNFWNLWDFRHLWNPAKPTFLGEPMIRGAIFDMDGVLLDNVDFHLEAFRKLGEEEGHPITREDVYRVFGRKNDDMLRVLLGRELTAEEADRLGRRKEAIYRELIRPTLREHVVPGLEAFLAALREARVAMAIATSGPPENVELIMKDLGLRAFFQAVVTGEEVTRGKPAPDAFLLAARKLGIPPAECVVFEDSVSGVKAALAAGCACVAVTTTHTAEELRPLGPDLIVRDFRELDVPAVQRLRG
ncbi:MAG: hypothetical protein Kow00109_26460 [Acidobacteriota bacterium]